MTLHVLLLSFLFSLGAGLNALEHAFIAVRKRKQYGRVRDYLYVNWIPLVHRAVIEALAVYVAIQNEPAVQAFLASLVGISWANVIEVVIALGGGLFGDVLLEKIVAKLPWITVPSLDDDNGSSSPGSSGPGAGGAAAVLTAALLLGCVGAATLPLTGCAAKAALQTSTPAAPNHPDQVDDLDGYAYDTLLVTRAVLDDAKKQYDAHAFDADRGLALTVINAARAAYDVARVSRNSYHDVKAGLQAGDASVLGEQLRQDLSDLAAAVAKVKKLHRVAPASGGTK